MGVTPTKRTGFYKLTFILLHVPLHSPKLDPLEEILQVVRGLPTQLCVLLSFLKVPHQASPINVDQSESSLTNRETDRPTGRDFSIFRTMAKRGVRESDERERKIKKRR